MRRSLLLAPALLLPLALPARAEPPAAPPAAPPAPAAPGALSAECVAKGEAALAKGAAFLKGLQGEDGAWGDPEIQMPAGVGFTAMAVSALVGAVPRSQRDADAALSKGLAYLVKNQKENGAIWSMDRYVTYETSAAVSALAMARRSEYRSAQVKGRDFLAQSQIAGDEKDPSYGGFPYASKTPQPADLSNLQFAVDALARGELPSDSPVWQRVQSYLKRVQNRSETNTASIEMPGDAPGEKRTIVSGDDGGAGYGPGMSKAGLKKRADGTYELRSYGSMTYALVKCLLLAGVDPKDPRVLAALTWLANHWTLERNPGFEEDKDPAKAGQQGLYYYFFTAARALALYEKASGKPLTVKDADGRPHEWRAELVERLVALQGEDGAWKNTASERWDEGSRVLASTYALQALAVALGKVD